MLIYLCISTYLYLYLTPGNSERQGNLTCCSPMGSQRIRHNLATEQQPQRGVGKWMDSGRTDKQGCG